MDQRSGLRRGRRRLRVVAGLVVTGVVAAVLAVAATASRQTAPKTTSPPTIEGKFQINETISASTGLWANNPVDFAYRWQRCNTEGSGCANIDNATSKSYKLTSADVDHTLQVLVTASNPDGQSTANSRPSPVVSGSEAPRNTQRPAISGKPQVGETMSVSKGQWTGGVRSYAYQWQSCDGSGNNCTDVGGATSSSYGVRTADKGKTLRAEVTAVNAAGKTSVTTDRSDVVQQTSAPSPAPTPSNGCDKSVKTVGAADLNLPVRLLIDQFSFNPGVVRRGTRSFTARIHISDTCGRSVGNAQLWSTAIPYNQTSLARGTTGSDGWATLQFTVKGGFPANPGRQQILAMLVRATKPGGSVLAGVSTRRTVRLNVSLH
jgi:hypothetical protein